MRKMNLMAILFSGFIWVAFSALAVPVSAQSWSNGYLHRRVITIDHTQVPNTDQTNFPFLLSGTYSFLATTSNGGGVSNSSGFDIIFTSDAAGSTTLPFEQESYISSTGAVDYWIQIPTLSHTADTVIYMFYGNSSISTDQSNKNAVWDSNFKGVWHLPNGSTLSASDSTSNGNTGSLVNTPTAVTGQIDGAAGLNGSNQYIRVTSSSSIKPMSALTLSGWVYLTGATNYSHLFSVDYRADGTWNSPYNSYSLGFYGSTDEPYANIAINGSFQTVGPGSALPLNTWHFLATTYDGATIRLFVDGTDVANTSVSGSISYNTSQDLAIGQRSPYSSSEYITGDLDELRISSTTRSADWIATEYHNQISPVTFYSVIAGDLPNGYAYRSAFTSDHTEGSNTDQTNFPVLISGTYSYLATTGNGGNVTNSNGYDIIVTSDSSGLNPLAFERESYTASSGAISLWVKIPTLSHTTDTVVYLFYGNSSVTTDQSSKTAVWDDNFKGVWHLNQDPTGTSPQILDSSANANNGIAQGSWTSGQQVAGEIGGSLSFVSTSSDYVSTANSFINPQTETIQAWFKSTSTAGKKIIGFENAQTGTSASAYDRQIWLGSDGKLYGGFSCTSPGQLVSSSSYNDGNWHDVVLTLDASAQQAKLYVDGGIVGTTNSCSGAQVYSGYFRIGAYRAGFWTNGSDGYFTGSIDEARISLSSRSADWIATEYANQSSPSSFYSIGSVVVAPSLTSLSPTSGAGGTSITITGANFGSTQGSSTVTFNGVAATPTSWSSTQIIAPVPGGTLTGNVIVTVASFPSNGLTFTDTSAGITALSPASGSIGTSVTIMGVNFGATQGLSTVTFNGTATTPTSWNSTQIVVPIPSGTTSGNVVVTVSGVASNGSYFTVTVPAITTLSPTSGVTGTSVTINGSNFGATQGTSTVTFNGVGATPTSWNSSSVTVPVPAAASTGNVVITVGLSSSTGVSFSVVPTITSLSPLSSLAGTPVTVTGTGFGATQGTSAVTFNGTSATPTFWSDTSIVVPVPSGATTGNVVVTVSGFNSAGASFAVLPAGWLDQDVGTVGLAGSAAYSSGTFTVNAAGADIYGTADAMHFVYQSLSGDGTIVARIVSFTGGGTYQKAGVMIRETLNPNSTNAFTLKQGVGGTNYLFSYRSTTSGSTSQASVNTVSLPYWLKVTRSGSSFSSYISSDGSTWTQVGSSQTISMATNVYFGMAATSENTSSLATATFDNASVTSSASPAPVITSVSATTGSIGSQVVISGTGFGATQSASLVMLNDAPTTINSWSNTSITITIPTGATSGYLVVAAGPGLDNSNPVYFTVTSQPLPLGWLDQDLGPVGLAGSASYSDGTITINAAGGDINGTTDAMHFVYQALSGDGTIVARVVSFTGGGTYQKAGVMIRETLTPSSTNAFTPKQGVGGTNYLFSYRSTTSGSTSQTSVNAASLPYWVKVTRSGSTFSGYISPDGSSWTQVGTSQTISMATDVYIGLAVTSNNTSSLATATFDNVSVNSTASPAPVISSVSATTGSIGTQVTISGSHFGASQGNSLVTLSAEPMTINSWSDTSITTTIASGAASGLMVVSVAPSMNDSNPVFFTVTTQALPSGWLDQDIGLVGTTGSAGYSSGTFTVNGAGADINGTADALHYVYQSLSGTGR